MPQQPQPIQPALGEFSPEEKVLLTHLQDKWLEAGADSTGAPIDQTSDKRLRDYDTAVNGQKDKNGNIITPPWMAPVDGIKYDPTKLEIKQSFGEKAGNFAIGVPIGVAEAVNPLSLPHNIEALGRGIGITAGKLAVGEGFHPLDSLAEAEKQTAVPSVGIQEKIAPAIRTGVRSFAEMVGGNLPNVSETFAQEQERQKALSENPSVQAGETTGEVGTAVLSLAQMAKSAGPALKGAMDKLNKLKVSQDVLSTGIGPQQFKESLDMQRRLLGDLGPELKKALFERPQEIKKLIESGGSNTLDTVNKVRDQLSTNKKVLGEAVGALRNAVTSDSPEVYDPSAITKSIQDLLQGSKFSGGASTLEGREIGTLNKFSQLASNNGKPLTTKDASILISKLDDYLDSQGYWMGEGRNRVNNALYGIRDAIDSEISARYPAYKEVKLRYSDFLKDYEKVQPRIENLSAEGTFNNMFGANKTEQREVIKGLMDRGKETADAFKNAVMDSKNISGGSQKYNDAVVKLREMADQLKTKSGQDLMNELANKAVARKLSNLADKDADELRSLVNTYVDLNVAKTKAAAGGVGGSVLGYIGYKLGGATGAAAGGYIGGKGAASLAEAVAKPIFTKKAESLFSVERLLDTISKEKQKAPLAAKFASDVISVSKKLGPDSANAFLNAVTMGGKLGSELKTSIDKALAAGSAAGGLMSAIQGSK